MRDAAAMLCVLLCAHTVAGRDFEGPVIGIDLGTTSSVVSVWQNGRVEIIANEIGSRITPSVVAFTESGRLIGDGAEYQMTQNPESTIHSVKRLIGRKYGERNLQADKKFLSYQVIQDEDRQPVVQVEVKGEKKAFTPEEISAMILGKMKETAEEFLGKNVKRAVVSVPASFNSAQRQSTRDAATAAGLPVALINAPAAAAIAYGLDKAGEKNILVFDLGGGTLDVSLIQIDDGFVEVVASDGDTHLGGVDFDKRMVKHFLSIIYNKHSKDLSKSKRALARLREACEAAKRQLSFQPEVRVEVGFPPDEGLHLSAPKPWSLPDKGLHFSEKITRTMFEELNMDLFKGTLNTVKAVIDDAKLNRTDIDEIVLVGGSTRIPKVRSLIKKFFNGKEPVKGINPDEAVAYGAAVQGAVLSRTSDLQDKVLVVDVVPLSMGIETLGGVMNDIIPRNTPLPTSKSRTFSTHVDNQTVANIGVFEGERPITLHNRLLGRWALSGIPLAPRGEPQIEVTFNVDEHGILLIQAETGTGAELRIVPTTDKDLNGHSTYFLVHKSWPGAPGHGAQAHNCGGGDAGCGEDRTAV